MSSLANSVEVDICPWSAKFLEVSAESAFDRRRYKSFTRGLLRCSSLIMLMSGIFLLTVSREESGGEEVLPWTVVMLVGMASGLVALWCARPRFCRCLGHSRLTSEVVAVAYFSLLAVLIVCADARHLRESLFLGSNSTSDGAPRVPAPTLRADVLLVVILLVASFVVPLSFVSLLCLVLLDIGAYTSNIVTRPSLGFWEVYPLALFLLSAVLVSKAKRDKEVFERLSFAANAGAKRAPEGQPRVPSPPGNAHAVAEPWAAVMPREEADVKAFEPRSGGLSEELESERESELEGGRRRESAAQYWRHHRSIGVQTADAAGRIQNDAALTTQHLASVVARDADAKAQPTSPRPARQPRIPGMPSLELSSHCRSAGARAKVRRQMAVGEMATRSTAERQSSACSTTHAWSSSSQRCDTGAQGSESSANRSCRGSGTAEECEEMWELHRQCVLTPAEAEMRNSPDSGGPSTASSSSSDVQPPAPRPTFDGRWLPMPLPTWLRELRVYGTTCVEASGQTHPIDVKEGSVTLCEGTLSLVGQLLVYTRPAGAMIAYSCVSLPTIRENSELNPENVDLGFNGIWQPIRYRAWAKELVIKGDNMVDGEGCSLWLTSQGASGVKRCRGGTFQLLGEHLVFIGKSDQIMSFVRS